jgi:hypothetical protein
MWCVPLHQLAGRPAGKVTQMAHELERSDTARSAGTITGGPVAQRSEQGTFNPRVLGSNPSRLTKFRAQKPTCT